MRNAIRAEMKGFRFRKRGENLWCVQVGGGGWFGKWGREREGCGGVGGWGAAKEPASG